jgi:carboxyl-terminal processing protease
VFRTRGRKRDVDTTYTTRRKGEFEWVPLIVLIDQHSASASEALAGSLQDHDRALLLGRRSFGKALMQTPLFVPSGDYVMLTVGYVLTPNGRLIQRRYRGLAAEQYRGFAGKTGAEDDTTKVFHTDNGREVRGGYGIAPDVVRPVAAEFPVWWSAASDSGFDHAVADSVAHLLAATPAARAAWMDGAADWHDRLVLPFLARVRTRLGVPAVTGDALGRRIAVNLAARVAEVRWGPEGLEEFVVRNDADVRAALDHLPRLAALLGPPGR